MRTNRIPVYRYAAVVIAALSLAAASSAQPNGPAPIANIRIDNFGKINDNYYRGAQPDGRDYADLAALGVRTVIDLTKDGRSDEQGMVERAGMKFYRIELTTTDRPADTAVARFLELGEQSGEPARLRALPGRAASHRGHDSCLPDDSGWVELRASLRRNEAIQLRGLPRSPDAEEVRLRVLHGPRPLTGRAQAGRSRRGGDQPGQRYRRSLGER